MNYVLFLCSWYVACVFVFLSVYFFLSLLRYFEVICHQYYVFLSLYFFKKNSVLDSTQKLLLILHILSVCDTYQLSVHTICVFWIHMHIDYYFFSLLIVVVVAVWGFLLFGCYHFSGTHLLYFIDKIKWIKLLIQAVCMGKSGRSDRKNVDYYYLFCFLSVSCLLCSYVLKTQFFPVRFVKSNFKSGITSVSCHQLRSYYRPFNTHYTACVLKVVRVHFFPVHSVQILFFSSGSRKKIICDFNRNIFLVIQWFS